MRNGVHAPTYRSWQMMKNRCLNPRATDYKYYGGRGITIPSNWHTYEGFVADMGLRPDGLTLDRERGNEAYSKNNCRWVNRQTQARNRDYTLTVTYRGVAKKTWEWAPLLGLSLHGFQSRLHAYRNGQITEQTVFAPSTRYRRNRGLGS